MHKQVTREYIDIYREMDRKYMDTYTTQANGECYFLLGVRYRRSGPWRSCYHLALLVVSVALFVTWKFVSVLLYSS